MSHFITAGILGSGAPNRLEINDFVKNEKHFSLFVQSLRVMQQDNQDDIPSFFSVSGIHGLPFNPWDGAVGNTPWDPETTWGGYCPHGSGLFPSWHRTYVSLVEQIIQSHAMQIAGTYTVDQGDWIDAATELRHPHWDWALNAVPPDQVIAQQQVTITGPDGNQLTVDNPFYQYNFHPIEPSFFRPFSLWNDTLRQPTNRSANAKDNVPRLKMVLQSAQSQITSSIFNLLTRVHDWGAFSNHSPGDGGSTTSSIEAIHDGIHVDVGGAGHMSDTTVAAYDPIFFLHHCNVDRMLQLWSALNPGVWVLPSDSQLGTFTIPADTPIDEDTPLTPFWNSQDTFWTSAALRDTVSLGYTYPDFNGLNVSNSDAVQTAIANRVKELYGSSVFGFSAAPGSSVVGAARSLGTSSAVPPTSSPAPAPLPAQPLFDWTCRIEFKKCELGSSFSLLIFLGEVSDNSSEWRSNPNFVGSVSAFTKYHACANRQTQKNFVMEGFVHLNVRLIERVGLDLKPEVVEPYLKQHLKWRVQMADGKAAHLDSLEVTVYKSSISYPDGSILPVYGSPSRRDSITDATICPSR